VRVPCWLWHHYRRWREVLSMRPLRASSEAEMVALFLRTELFSGRFGAEIRALLDRDGVPERVVAAPPSAMTPAA